MAEPAWKVPRGESWERQERQEDDEPSGTSRLLRWVERPDGGLEQVELPLTPEDFLDPQLEDRWLQGQRHGDIRDEMAVMLRRHFRPRSEFLVVSDMKHFLGVPGQPNPGPDISITRGVRVRDLDRSSFDVAREGVRPCLLIEILSPIDARIRRVDERDKVEIYARAGIPEYVLITPPRPRLDRFGVRGYRLGPDGRYRPMEPEGQGRLLSETTGLLFGVSEAGDRFEIFDAGTGRRLLSPFEDEEARKAAEARAAAAEEELERLRAEVERLRDLTP